MTSTLFCGGEDLDFQFIGASLQTTPTVGSWATDTTAGRFRAGYARYGLTLITQGLGSSPDWTPIANTAYIRNISSFSSSSFWCTCRHVANSVGNAVGIDGAGLIPIRWADASGILRLRIKLNTSSFPTSTFVVEKIDASLATTQIGSASLVGLAHFANDGSSDKLDFFVNYGVSGEVKVYLNGVLTLDVTGDLTTNGNSSLSYFDLGQTATTITNGSNYRVSWSEAIVSTGDTRNQSLITRAPVKAGNTDQWSSNTSNDTESLGAIVTTSTQSANTVLYAYFNATNSGVLSSISFNLNTGITGNTQAALYTDNGTGTVPITKLASSSVVTNPSSGATVYSFTGGPIIEPGVGYWAAFWANAAYGLEVGNSSTAVGNLDIQTGLSGGFPNTASATILSSTSTPSMNVITTKYDVSGFSASDMMPDSSNSSGQIQEYTVPTLPSGNFAIIDVTQVVRSAGGATGPTNIELGARIGGTEYFSGTTTPTAGWERITYTTATNPATSSAYTVSDLDNAGYNIAIKSAP